MINIDLVIDGKSYKISTMFSMYMVCRKISTLWLEKSINDIPDIETYKKEKDVLYDIKLREDEALELLNKIDLSKDLNSFTLFELVQLNSAIGSLFKAECSKIDATDPNLLGTVEAALYVCAAISKVTNGLPVYEAVSAAINEAKCHIPSGHEYIDVVSMLLDHQKFADKETIDIAHRIFDPIIKICGGK